MATPTLEELRKQGNLVTRGNFLGPQNSNLNPVVRGRGQSNTGTQRTGSAAADPSKASPLARATREFIGGVAPRPRTQPVTTAADRVNAALAIYNPADNSRGQAEAVANPAIAEQLRLNLINQERIRKGLQTGGAPMNPVEYRAALREAEINQNAVTAGIGGINAMREANVMARGQDVQSATTLGDRELAEAGAFDRAQTNLDIADLQGQYGLGRAFLEGSMSRDAIVAGRQTLNPLEAARLRLGAGIEQGIGNLPADQQAGRYAAVMDAYAGQPLAPSFAPGTQAVTLSDGSEIQLSDERALGVAALRDPEVRAMLEAEGYVLGENGALSRVTGQGQAVPGNGRQITTQVQGGVGGTPAQTDGFAPPPINYSAALFTGGTGASGLGVGQLTASSREQQGREAMAEIGQVIASGFPETDANTRAYEIRRWASNRRDYIATLSPSDQRQLYNRLGETVAPYLTIDPTGGN